MTPRLRQSGSQVVLLNDNDQVVEVFGTGGSGDSSGRVATAGDYVMKGGEQIVAVTSTAAARSVTLPLASTVSPGEVLVVKDESGACATNNITVNRSGSDTIDGATTKVINTNYGTGKFYSDGVSKWFTW